MPALTTATPLRPFFSGQATLDPVPGLTRFRGWVLGLSWFAILALGTLPIFETLYERPTSFVGPATLAFCVTVSSVAILRRHYSWIGAALHVLGQICIYLSLFLLALAMAVLA